MNDKINNVIDVVLTDEDIRQEQQEVADKLGVSIEEAYKMMDNGELKGTIKEAQLHMLRFLTEGDNE